MFKTKMNDNLKVSEAVSALYRVVDEISSIRKKSGLTEGTRLYLRNELQKIDGVLGILFD